MTEKAAIVFLAWCVCGVAWGPDVMLVSTFPLAIALNYWLEDDR